MTNNYVNKVEVNGSAIIDLTSDTVDAAHLANGYTAHDASGAPIVGTATGGGSSAWTKVAETSYQVSTTQTSAQTVATWETGHSELWTSDKWVYVRIRDTAGKRNSYFYGSDTYFFNIDSINGESSTSVITCFRMVARYYKNAFVTALNNSTTGYGVYADTLYSDGRIRIRSRYSASNSSTIDGTYKVEVYLLDPAGGVPIFG